MPPTPNLFHALSLPAIHTAAASLTSAVALAALGTAATAADAASAGSAVSAAADAVTAVTAVADAGWLPAQLLDRSPSSWALIVYSSLGPGALATYLQAAGQAKVPATQAQVCRHMS